MDRVAPHKESIVLLVYSEPKKKHYIIVKLAHSSKAQLIRIDAESGILRWDQSVGRDTFESEAEALAYLQDHTQVEVLAHAKYVLGYVVLGPVALLLLADAVRASAALPGGHEIKTVTQSKWHRISLQQPDLDATTQAAAKAELDRGIEKTMSFPMDGAHYFCETLDITRPFPSERPAGEPSWPFVWNKALTLPFRAAGLDGPKTVCPALLQGMAESRELEDFDGRRFSYCLISRKCRLHVGPRYKARGLNENSDPGNEIECDQVVWRHSDSPEQPLAWSRYTWRRGSVPLWWTVNIKNGGMGEAEIKIRSTNTFRGSKRYVRRLQKRYMPDSHLNPDSDDGTVVGGDASEKVPVVFFSLLRKGTPDRDRSEAKLAEAFDFMAGQLRSVHKLPVSYVALDWHQMDKELGSEALVEGFWAQLSSLLPSQGFALGTMSKVGADHNDNEGQELSASISTSGSPAAAAQPLARGCGPVGKGWVARWYKQQRGVTRYNCADSLDRTNVGSFFGAVQVFVEQCRELDIAIAATSHSAASVARQALIKRQAAAATAAVLAAAGSNSSGAAGSAAGSLDKRGGSSSSSGFLSSLGKGLNTVMGDLKMSPRTASPKGDQPWSSLSRDLRVSSAPNITAMQQGPQQQMQLLRGPADNPWQQQQQQKERQQQSSGDELPPGWEAKYDAVNKRVFYVDHNTKTTTWNRPQWAPLPRHLQQQQAPSSPLASNGAAAAPSTGSSCSSSSQEQQLASLPAGSNSNQSPVHSRPNSSHKSLQVDDAASGSDSESERERYEPLTPWCMFHYRCAKVKYFARRINPAALSAIAELFLMNGDMCAWLYTGSPAMHSEKITMFEAETSRLKKAGAGAYSNSFIAIRRRYNNVLMDEERKMQAEIFLGIKNKTYFPTLHIQYRESDSVPDDFPESEDDESGNPDPLGLLTWPLESKARAAAGSAAALIGMGPTLAAAAGVKERQSLGNFGYDGSELSVERAGKHTRSFSSDKIFQDFRELHRVTAGQQQPPSALGIAAGLPKGDSQSVLAGGRPPLSGTVRPTPAAAAATTAVAAAGMGSKSLADFDSELSDRAPPVASVLKPFEDPLGLL